MLRPEDFKFEDILGYFVRLVSERKEGDGGRVGRDGWGEERELDGNPGVVALHGIAAPGRLKQEDYLNLRIQKFQTILGHTAYIYQSSTLRTSETKQSKKEMKERSLAW